MRLLFRRHSQKTFRLNHPREREPVPVVAAGAMAAEGLFNGRMLPVLILQPNAREDIAELIRVHEFTGPGDVNIQWGEGPTQDQIRLFLEFVRPVRTNIILDFHLAQWGLLVDQILQVRGFYIQVGDESTKISSDPLSPKIVCEIPDTGIRPFWDKLLRRYTIKLFKRLGYSRAEAKRAASQYITDWRSANKAPEELANFLGAEVRWIVSEGGGEGQA